MANWFTKFLGLATDAKEAVGWRTISGHGYQPCAVKHSEIHQGRRDIPPPPEKPVRPKPEVYAERKPLPGTNVYKMALAHYGINHQVEVAKEEAAEFILALSHYYNRGRGSLDNVCEETADLKIMIGQLEMATDPALVEKYYQEKLARLHGRIMNEKLE